MAYLDPETVLETLVVNTKLNDEVGRLTFYAVICPEHGGLVAGSAPEAIDAASSANAVAAQVDSDCDYYAVAIGLDASLVAGLLADPPEGS